VTAENFAAVQSNGLQFTVNVPIAKGRPRRVKAVLYDYGGDRLGSALSDVR
jgi:hypothetical protein